MAWAKLSLDSPLRGRWSLYSEIETRRGNAPQTAQQLGGVSFRLHIGPSFSLTTGYVLAANDCGRPHGTTAPEHRFYPEVTRADATGPVRASHRLRAEERWLRSSPEAAFRFAPRLRYQLRLVVPLHSDGQPARRGPRLGRAGGGPRPHAKAPTSAGADRDRDRTSRKS